jgi:hypothetical protein
VVSGVLPGRAALLVACTGPEADSARLPPQMSARDEVDRGILLPPARATLGTAALAGVERGWLAGWGEGGLAALREACVGVVGRPLVSSGKHWPTVGAL